MQFASNFPKFRRVSDPVLFLCVSFFAFNALPAFAASPFEDYLAWRKAMESMSAFPDVRKYYLKSQVATIERTPFCTEPLGLASLRLGLDFSNPTLVSEKIDGEKATLVVDGTIATRYSAAYAKLLNSSGQGKMTLDNTLTGKKRRMTMPMILEDGIWKQGPGATSNDGASNTSSSQLTGATSDVWRSPFSNKLASGTINGKPFTVGSAVLYKNESPRYSFIDLIQGASPNQITFRVTFEATTGSIYNQEVVFKDNAQTGAPGIKVDTQNGSITKVTTVSYQFTDHWGLRLRMMPPKSGKSIGYIGWKAANKTQDHLEGSFNATVIDSSVKK